MPTIRTGRRYRVYGLKPVGPGSNMYTSTKVTRVYPGKKFTVKRRGGLASAVKKVINRTAETKYITTQSDRSFNSSVSSPTECYELVPQVTQGDGDHQRIGDKIRGKYLIIRGHVQWDTNFLQQHSTTGYLPPATLRVMILSQNNVKVGSEVSTRASPQFLLKDNVGTGVARAYTGGMWDNLAPINKDLFRVHMDKKVKLNFVNWSYSTTGGGGQSESQAVGNDRTKYFYCKIPINRTMKFDDINLNYPNSFAPFICLGGVNDDGTSAWSLQTPYRMSWNSTLYFTDT